MANNLLLLKIYQLLIRIKLLTSCPCWWYKQLLSKSTLYAGGTNNCFFETSLRWRCRRLLSESPPYVGGTNSCFLYQLPNLQEVRTVSVAFLSYPYAAGT